MHPPAMAEQRRVLLGPAQTPGWAFEEADGEF